MRSAISRTDHEVVVVMCGPLAGLSGGDIHALRFVDRWDQMRPGSVVLMSPGYMAGHLSSASAQVVRALRTPFDDRLQNLVVYAVAVLVRMVVAAVRMPRTRIAIASSHFIFDVVPCLAARLRRRTRVAVFVYHLIDDMERTRTLRSRVSAMAERTSLWLLRRWADVVFVDNREVAESLERRGFAGERIVMTANAFDPSIPIPPRGHDGSLVLAYCGRFVEEKGIWDVLVLARRLQDVAPHARIEMIGDGPLRREFAERAAASGVGNVVVHGFVPEEDKWALLRRARLFIAPSREEGWGIAVGEALTAETPVLAYDLPAYRYLGDAIERVPPGDTGAYVAAVERLIGDPSELARLTGALRDARGRLPRWDDVLDAEFETLRERCL